MENLTFIGLIAGFIGFTFIVQKFRSTNSLFKNSAEFLSETIKRENKIGEFEIKKLAEGLV